MNWLAALTTDRCVSVAIGLDRLVLVEFQRGRRTCRIQRVARRPLEPPGESAQEWEALRDGLEEAVRMCTSESDETLEIQVALLRPLCYAKVVDLPPIPDDDLRRLLQENAPRYFPVQGPVITDARVLNRPGDEDQARVLVSCARQPSVDAVADALRATDCRLQGIVPGPIAELEARLAFDATGDVREGGVLIGSDDRLEVVVLSGGEPSMFCPIPTGAASDRHERASEYRKRMGPEVLPSSEIVALDVGVADDSRQVRAGRRSEDAGDPSTPLAPEAVAALGVPMLMADGPFLERQEARQDRRTRARWRTVLLTAAALLMLGASGLLYGWGLERELHAVKEARTAIRSSVVRTIRERRNARRVADLIGQLQNAERRRARWSDALTALALHLPDQFHLRSFVHDSSASVITLVEPDSADHVRSALEEASVLRAVRGQPRGGSEASGRRFRLTWKDEAVPGRPAPLTPHRPQRASRP